VVLHPSNQLILTSQDGQHTLTTTFSIPTIDPHTSRSAWNTRPAGPTSHTSTRSGLAITSEEDPGEVKSATRRDWRIGVGG